MRSRTNLLPGSGAHKIHSKPTVEIHGSRGASLNDYNVDLQKSPFFFIVPLWWEMAQKEYHERVFPVGGIRKNAQPIENRFTRSFSAPTLRRRPAQKVVPQQTGLKVKHFYTADVNVENIITLFIHVIKVLYFALGLRWGRVGRLFGTWRCTPRSALGRLMGLRTSGLMLWHRWPTLPTILGRLESTGILYMPHKKLSFFLTEVLFSVGNPYFL